MPHPMAVAYPVLISQHAPPSQRPGHRRCRDTRSPPPATRNPDDWPRAAGGGSRVTGRGSRVVALPAPIPNPLPAAGRPHPGIEPVLLTK